MRCQAVSQLFLLCFSCMQTIVKTQGGAAVPGQGFTFCNRVFHASTIADDVLYVDEGELRNVTTDSDRNASVQVSVPSTISYINTSNLWNNADDNLWGHIKKNDSIGSAGPPSLIDGAIFSNSTSLWLYGCEMSSSFGIVTEIPPNGVWRYDFASSEWSNPSPGGDPVQRLSKGSYVQANASKAFWLGGNKSPYSDQLFNAEENSLPYMVQGLLSLDEDEQNLSNSATVGMNEAGTVMNGFLASLTSIGDQGILVAFGGYTNIRSGNPDLLQSLVEDPTIRWQMQDISIYDIATQQWYQQQASGDVPSWRRDGCSVIVSAPDQSSHSIYVFGGWGNQQSTDTDGNVYVLSLPWIRVTLDDEQRFRHQCHLMGQSYMVVIGGNKVDGNIFPDSPQACDTNPRFNQGLGIFSLNNHEWTTDYDHTAGAASYRVHDSISMIIGGDHDGGATKRQPDAGFASDPLRTLFEIHDAAANSSDTASVVPGPANATDGLGKGAIAGIAVGSALGAALLIAASWMILRRRRQQQQRRRLSKDQILTQGDSSNPSPQIPGEMATDPHGPELVGGAAEESLARMYRSNELTSSTGIYEISEITDYSEMPSPYHGEELPESAGSPPAELSPSATLHLAPDTRSRRRQ